MINVFNLSGSSQTTQCNDHTTELDYWNLILSLRRPLQSFCQYLKKMLDVVVRRHDTGSLLLTVECRSLQILEGLWKDYCSGHLNEMAQESLITAEVLEKLGCTGKTIQRYPVAMDNDLFYRVDIQLLNNWGLEISLDSLPCAKRGSKIGSFNPVIPTQNFGQIP